MTEKELAEHLRAWAEIIDAGEKSGSLYRLAPSFADHLRQAAAALEGRESTAPAESGPGEERLREDDVEAVRRAMWDAYQQDPDIKKEALGVSWDTIAECKDTNAAAKAYHRMGTAEAIAVLNVLAERGYRRLATADGREVREIWETCERVYYLRDNKSPPQLLKELSEVLPEKLSEGWQPWALSEIARGIGADAQYGYIVYFKRRATERGGEEDV